MLDVLEFLNKCNDGYRIISSVDATVYQLIESKKRGLYFKEGSSEWILLPWDEDCIKDIYRSHIKYNERFKE